MWEVRAEYADGTSLEKYFEDSNYKTDNEQQYELEEYAITFHECCVWYSVNYIWTEDDA